LSIHALVAKIYPTKLCDSANADGDFWRHFASCISASRVQCVSDCIVNSH